MTVSQQIIEVLDALCEKFGVAIDWANANVMPQVTDLMQRAVLYCMVTSAVKLILPVIYIIFYFWRLCKFIYKCRHNMCELDDTEFHVLLAIIGGFVCLFAIGYVAECINVIITCAILPEKVIYDMLTSMVSQ